MSASRAASIEASGLVREFKKGPRAVDGIDLHIAPGEIYGFLGPNGAGKSTTTLMLTTLLPPTAGSARVAGYDVVREGPRVRAVIGAALQEVALDPLLTGTEHMRLQTALHGLPREERAVRGAELLARLAAVLERFGERTESSTKGVTVRMRGGERDLAEVVRALDAEAIAVEHIQLHAPSLDDVFLAKTGHSLEGSGEREAGAGAGASEPLLAASKAAA